MFVWLGGVYTVGGISFWDTGIWSFITTMAVLLGAMLLANALRRRITFLRKSLIPSSVLGGFLVLGINALFKAVFGFSMYSTATLETLTYHGLGLGFVALAWRRSEKVKGKKARRDVFSTSTVMVGGYLIQGFLGLVVTLGLHYLIGSYAAAGALLPMGYGQGPGQAYNWGHTFEMYTEYEAFTNGTSFGLTVAAMGFVSAGIGGLIYLSRLRASGDARAQLENAEELENLSAIEVCGRNEIPMSESMDKLTVQVGLIFGTYAVTFGLMRLITVFLDRGGNFTVNTVKPLIWGFNFLMGTAVTILFRTIYGLMRKKNIIRREYVNTFMLNRISGLMFDIMVVASIGAIDLSAFRYREFVIPLTCICIVGAVSTYIYCKKLCEKLFPGYVEEMFLVLYGTLTGTASTGVILLREIDNEFKTPASHNLIYQNLWSIILGAPILLLIGFVARSITWTLITIAALGLMLVIMRIVQCFLIKAAKNDR